LSAAVGPLRGKIVAVWGLAYKPGTDTLRRSSAVELCVWLAEHGASVRAYDPAVKSLPSERTAGIVLTETALAATAGAAALVIATEWPEFRSVDAEAVAAAMTSPVVIDANRFLVKTLGCHPKIQYLAVGTGNK
jgi:UDPglucose 6-dehydrogenase